MSLRSEFCPSQPSCIYFRLKMTSTLTNVHWDAYQTQILLNVTEMFLLALKTSREVTKSHIIWCLISICVQEESFSVKLNKTKSLAFHFF